MKRSPSPVRREQIPRNPELRRIHGMKGKGEEKNGELRTGRLENRINQMELGAG